MEAACISEILATLPTFTRHKDPGAESISTLNCCESLKPVNSVTFAYNEQLPFAHALCVFIPLKLLAIVVKVLDVFSAK
jgi:hypothetical protein